MVRALACALALPGGVLAQEPGPSASRIPPSRLSELLDRGDPAALPELRQLFKDAQDLQLKLVLAGSLVRLKDPDPAYWAFLAREATGAVENEMPFPIALDPQGQLMPGQMSEEFLAWCGARHRDPEVAASEAIYQGPAAMVALAVSADPRGLDILRRGLESRNYFVAGEAAQGLARVQDQRAIQPIIGAARRAPRAARDLFGTALVFFDDPEAQAAAEELIQDKRLLKATRERAKTQGPRGIFGF